MIFYFKYKSVQHYFQTKTYVQKQHVYKWSYFDKNIKQQPLFSIGFMVTDY